MPTFKQSCIEIERARQINRWLETNNQFVIKQTLRSKEKTERERERKRQRQR